MSGQTNERAFETHVEEVLLQQGGWQSGTNAEWDVERALFPAQVCRFLETTQPKLWAQMRTLHAAGLEKLILAALVKELDQAQVYYWSEVEAFARRIGSHTGRLIRRHPRTCQPQHLRRR